MKSLSPKVRRTTVIEFTKVVAERYSCKNFSTRKVEAEKLTEILEAGRLAPTAKNFQEQRVYVLQSEESLAKLDKVTPCRYGAPTCLVVAFDTASLLIPAESGTPAWRMPPSWRPT